jgi:hypothetical protein
MSDFEALVIARRCRLAVSHWRNKCFQDFVDYNPTEHRKTRVEITFSEGRERKSDRKIKSYLDARLLVSFLKVSYCGNRKRAFMFDHDTKEKEHQNTRQSY